MSTAEPDCCSWIYLYTDWMNDHFHLLPMVYSLSGSKTPAKCRKMVTKLDQLSDFPFCSAWRTTLGAKKLCWRTFVFVEDRNSVQERLVTVLVC